MIELHQVSGRALDFQVHDLPDRIVEVRSGSDRVGEMVWHDPTGSVVEARTESGAWVIRTSNEAVEVREVGCDCLVGLLDRVTGDIRVAAARPLTWNQESRRLLFHDQIEALTVEEHRVHLAPRTKEHPDGPLLVMLAVHLNAIGESFHAPQ